MADEAAAVGGASRALPEVGGYTELMVSDNLGDFADTLFLLFLIYSH